MSWWAALLSLAAEGIGALQMGDGRQRTHRFQEKT